MPMPVNVENTALYRWLDKPVSESRLLDDMEESSGWTHSGFGEMAIADERSFRGLRSLRITSPTYAANPGATVGRPPGACSVRRRFEGEDWQAYNRISFWVYPVLPGFRTISMTSILFNEGEQKVPGPYSRHGRNYFLLEPDRWNHVVWEITHLGRDKVTGLEIAYRLQGNEPGATDSVCFYIDHLELQKVVPDHYEGWSVAPGEIAFSHTGYSTGGTKRALTRELSAERFDLIDQKTGLSVFGKSIENLSTRIGRYSVMDFTEFREPGLYIIKAGELRTRPFRIHDDVWRETAVKTINFFYCVRCGDRVEGIHDVCHRDWRVRSDEGEIVINGGWHDAGDLSQGLVNTSEAVYAMFDFAEHRAINDPVLAERLIEEARWGLDWILKCRFGQGARCVWATMDFWTDGIMGTMDDVVVQAQNEPFANFLAASAEAIAGRLLRDEDPIRASYALKAAKEDWRFAMEKSENPNLQLAATAVQASMDLYMATGDRLYADKAISLSTILTQSQQKKIPDWDIPILGFFYTGTARDRILHYFHRSHEQAPVVALVTLCEAFPNHPDWMNWYSTVVLYSEYMKQVATYTEPFSMLPASIYDLTESEEENFRHQVLNGIRLDETHYLRLFPVWEAFRGNYGVMLSQTSALSAAAHLRNDLDLIHLCENQLQWVVGKNPFVQSTMYGEGYNYAPQYTAMSGNMVGSLPVGIETRFDRDAPYWPTENCYNWKEVWVHPSSRWLAILSNIAGAATVEGTIASNDRNPIEFTELHSDKIYATRPNSRGEFRTTLPSGYYRIGHGETECTITILPAQKYNLVLGEFVDFVLSSEDGAEGTVSIRIEAQGNGEVNFDVRTQNLRIKNPAGSKESPGQDTMVVSYDAEIMAQDEPWVVVVIPNGDLSLKKELIGMPLGMR